MTPKLRIDRAPPRSNLVVGQARINRTGLARPGLSRLQIGLGVPVARTALGVPARGLNRPLLAAHCRRLVVSDALAGFQASLVSEPVLSSLAAAMVGACSLARVDRRRAGLVGWIGAQGLARVALAGVVLGLRPQCRHVPPQHHHGLAADTAPGRSWRRGTGRRSCLGPLAPALHAGHAIQASH